MIETNRLKIYVASKEQMEVIGLFRNPVLKALLDIYRKVEKGGYMEMDICFPLKD